MGRTNAKTKDIIKSISVILFAALFLLAGLSGCTSLDEIQPLVSPSAAETSIPAHTPAPKSSTPKPASTPEPPPMPTPDPFFDNCIDAPRTRNLYEAVLAVDMEEYIVTGQLRATIVNTSTAPMHMLKFRLHPNDVSSGCMNIEGVLLNREAAEYYFDDAQKKSVLCVALDRELAQGESAEVFVAFDIMVPITGFRFGVSGPDMMLGNALPIAAVYDSEGVFHTEPYCLDGDSFFSEIADYNVRVSIPAEYNLAHTGVLTYSLENEDAEQTLCYIDAEAVREFALAVMNPRIRIAYADTSVTDTRVTAFGRTKQEASAAALTAALALDFYSIMIGEYPYQSLMVVPVDWGGGMEYPNLIMVSPPRDPGEAERRMSAIVIAHEVCHQWFYSVVGNNQLTEPWLDESIVEYLAFGFLESFLGTETRNSYWRSRIANSLNNYTRTARLDLPLADYKNYDYFYVVYAYGADMYNRLCEELGKDAFETALRIYYSNNSFKIATKAELIAAFSEAAGKNMSDWFEWNMEIRE